MKFKVGDKVRCIDSIGESLLFKNSEYDILEVDDETYFTIQLKYKVSRIRFELAERKIGDKWFKAEELNEDGMPIDSHIGKIPVEGVDFHMTEVNKEEFKVDRLGWYEDDVGRKLKHLHTHKSNSLFPHSFLLVDDIIRVQSNGEFYHDAIKNKIIKYLGPELPKESRKFEFEGYVCEYPETKDKFFYAHSLMENQFGYRVTEVYDSKEYAEKRLSQIETKNGIISKWKFTMEELIENE